MFHATCVGIFLLTSIVHMTLVCTNYIKIENKRLIATNLVKKKIAIVNFAAIVFALYLYDRHNRYCEPGIYSMFSFLEYIVIIANIIYHLQAYYDLADYSIVITNLY